MKPTTPAITPSAQTKATPQQQQIYDATMVAARRVLYGEQNDDSRFKILLQKLSGTKDEIGPTIGQTAAVVLSNIKGAAAKAGKDIPGPILFAAGREVISDIIGIAQAAKLLPEGQQAQIEQEALQAGLQSFQHAQQPAVQGAQPAPAGAPPAAEAAPAPPAPTPGIIAGARA